mmetsp:Transcript_351/g.876  ORF Transcript_351/g.876 Transcript_351/m.876 type:complete len:81 (-) Transcript_351:1953-2195(-)|eukprot:33958-Pelagomonas_calceolata.AAC.6
MVGSRLVSIRQGLKSSTSEQLCRQPKIEEIMRGNRAFNRGVQKAKALQLSSKGLPKILFEPSCLAMAQLKSANKGEAWES